MSKLRIWILCCKTFKLQFLKEAYLHQIINDIICNPERDNVKLFADDTAIIITIENMKILNDMANSIPPKYK